MEEYITLGKKNTGFKRISFSNINKTNYTDANNTKPGDRKVTSNHIENMEKMTNHFIKYLKTRNPKQETTEWDKTYGIAKEINAKWALNSENTRRILKFLVEKETSKLENNFL